MNSLFLISPYKHSGQWVFDDARVGLVREALIAGIDVMLDRLTAEIAGAAEGFNLVFSTQPFPGWQARLEWRREEYGGNWYYSPQFGIEGWLCPALFKYFDTAPRELYAKASARS